MYKHRGFCSWQQSAEQRNRARSALLPFATSSLDGASFQLKPSYLSLSLLTWRAIFATLALAESFDQIEFLSASIKDAVDLANNLEARRKVLFESFAQRLQHLAEIETAAFVDSHILSEEGAYAAYLAAVKAKEEPEVPPVVAEAVVEGEEDARGESLDAAASSSAPASPSQVAALVALPDDPVRE